MQLGAAMGGFLMPSQHFRPDPIKCPDPIIPSSHHPEKLKSSQKLKSGDLRFRLIKSQVRGSYAREKVNEHFSIVSGDCTLHDDSYGCFAVANASIDREIWTNKGDLARVTKYGNILMVLLGIATMNNLE
jgi:hypothetical protein